MYPAPFDYVAAASVADAIEALSALAPDAKVLAGGQSLIPLMKLRLAAPSYVIDIGSIQALRGVGAAGDGTLRIGALATEAELERSAVVRDRWPVLAQASSMIADPLVRNRATVGGNLAHGDPANDHPAVMTALGAKVTLTGVSGERVVPAADFFVDLFETALADDELLTEIRVPPIPPGSACVYVKRERQVGDYAIAGAAVYLRFEDDEIREARIVLTNAGAIPVRVVGAEQRLAGAQVRTGLAEQAADAAAAQVAPTDSVRGSAAYRTQIFRLAVEEAVWRAIEDAKRGERR